MTPECEFLIKAVKDASAFITEDFIIEAKDSDGDLLTSCDTQIEKFLIKRIHRKYPGFGIVSEEFNDKKHLTKNCFLIDPIDGTINFAFQIPLWGIQVACRKNGRTVAAVIYLPRLNELYCADKSGAYLNGRKIHVNNASVSKALYAIEGGDKTSAMTRMRAHSRHFRYACCACVNFGWVACGRLSGMIYRKNYYWDYIPGQFIVKQAGGYIYNRKNCHIAANSQELCEIMKKDAIL